MQTSLGSGQTKESSDCHYTEIIARVLPAPGEEQWDPTEQPDGRPTTQTHTHLSL